MTVNVQELNSMVRDFRTGLDPLYGAIEQVIVGQRTMIDRLLVGLLTGGHMLLEGVPGLAKTLAVRTLAAACASASAASSSRRTCCPPTSSARRFTTRAAANSASRKGRSSPTSFWPTRSTAPGQGAERSAGSHAGKAGHHRRQQLHPRAAVPRAGHAEPHRAGRHLSAARSPGRSLHAQAQADVSEQGGGIDHPQSHVRHRAELDHRRGARPCGSVRAAQGARSDLRGRQDQALHRRYRPLPRASRPTTVWTSRPYIQYGASPRATIFLARAAKAQAFLDGRGYVTPQDVKSIGHDVLRHRVSVTYEAEAEDITSEMLLQRIFDSLKVP